jgi:alkylation response protein AidB-like acyl-CoA dehydrogenase
MDLALTEEQAALVASFADLLAKRSSTEQVRAAEPEGFDPSLWEALLGIGVVEMAVPEAAGGWGAGMLDLALVAEQVGAAVAPAPVIEAQVAARLLAAAGADPGERMTTLAVRPAVGSRATLVPAGAVADDAVVLVADRLLRMPLEGARQPVANLAAAPLADITVGTGAGTTEVASGPAARKAFEAALDEWLVLTAGALVGIASSAHRVTCEYARERHTWGVPIGAYQAVAHPLADGATAIDGARLLVGKAAWELQADGPRGRELAAMAFAFAAETARQVTYDAVHFHGGYGFMLEYDVQLHWRRARGWPRVWGDAEAAYRRVATERYGGGA